MMLRAFGQSAFVTRHLPTRHSYLKEIGYGADAIATGGSQNEIRGSPRGMKSGAFEPGRSTCDGAVLSSVLSGQRHASKEA
jgi:hypothetical protein